MTMIGNLRDRPVRRLTQLYTGLLLYGISMALMIRSDLGLDPWDVFHQGLSRQTGLTIGTVSIIVGALVLLLWIPLRQRPGLGTVSNVFVVGLSVDATLALLPPGGTTPVRTGMLVAGIVLNGMATGLYLGGRFGPGPRDGLMTGYVARHPGRSIRVVRTTIEVAVLALGWLLGGTVGIGTLAYALAIGPLAHVFVPLFAVPVTPSPPDDGATPPTGDGPAPPPDDSTARLTDDGLAGSTDDGAAGSTGPAPGPPVDDGAGAR
jgi:uncharacterized membrane protein YczE